VQHGVNIRLPSLVTGAQARWRAPNALRKRHLGAPAQSLQNP
jgi:hypothetical protein